MSTTASWWPTPRPRRYRPVSVTVTAIEYDASEPALDAVRHWVRRCAGTDPTTIRVADRGSLIIDQTGAEAVRVGAGDFLVLRQERGSAQWSSCPAHDFQDRFQVLPHELPIYDDGEAS